MNLKEKIFGVRCVDCEGYHKRVTSANWNTIKDYCAYGGPSNIDFSQMVWSIQNPKKLRRCKFYDKKRWLNEIFKLDLELDKETKSKGVRMIFLKRLNIIDEEVCVILHNEYEGELTLKKTDWQEIGEMMGWDKGD